MPVSHLPRVVVLVTFAAFPVLGLGVGGHHFGDNCDDADEEVQEIEEDDERMRGHVALAHVGNAVVDVLGVYVHPDAVDGEAHLFVRQVHAGVINMANMNQGLRVI